MTFLLLVHKNHVVKPKCLQVLLLPAATEAVYKRLPTPPDRPTLHKCCD